MYTPRVMEIMAVMGLALYVYQAICFQRIARGRGLPHTWFSWVPILNVYLVCRIAGKRYVYTVLCFVPIVQIVMYFIICFKVARACGRSRWMGLLLIIPVVGLFALWRLVELMEAETDHARTVAANAMASEGGGNGS
jgi:uncharacterized membrane protein YhaH (DUF805 family)